MKNAWIFVLIGAIAVIILLAARDMYVWNSMGRKVAKDQKPTLKKGRTNIVTAFDGSIVFMEDGKYFQEYQVQCIQPPCPPMIREISEAQYVDLSLGPQAISEIS